MLVWTAIAIAVLAFVFSVIAVFSTGRSARRATISSVQALEAAEQALAAAEDSAESVARSAQTYELMLELEQRRNAAYVTPWQISFEKGAGFVLINDGAETALDVIVSGPMLERLSQELGPWEMGPRATQRFYAAGDLGPAARWCEVVWRRPNESELRTWRVDLPG